MIRHASPDDAAAIAAVHISAWRAAYRGIVPEEYLASMSLEGITEFWQRVIDRNLNPVLVAVEEGQVVGWVSGGESRDTGAAELSEVYAIYISPAFQGHGIGRHLMRSMEESFPASREVTLWVFALNPRAQAFYRRSGYEFDGTRQTFQLGGADLEELRYRKKLGLWNPTPEAAQIPS